MHFPTTLLLSIVLFGLSYSQSLKYQEKYITVPIDHFNFVNEKSFQLRYLINDTYTHGNLSAPILFYCGNEADIEFFAKETGLVWELAPKLQALVIFAEGRYFGKSLPFGSDSMNGRDHYGYLTIEQTLADFAALLNYLNGSGALRRPAIAIGGSHGGVLAAFLRMKYPDLVAGALASSAPMRKFSNLTRCDVYSRIITNVFENAYTSSCTSNIKKSWTVLKAIAGGPKGVEIFNDVFKFCHPWTSSNEVDDLLDSIDGMYWKMSQTNYPYPADYYTPLPANPVRAFCTHLDTEFDGLDLVKALYKALNVYTNHDGKKHCFEFPKRQAMKPLDLEAFEFQRCSEIIMAFCSDGKQDMFRPLNETFESVVENCKRQYGIRVDQDVNRIKIHFGVDNLKTVTNTIFSNGLLDPWSGASILVAPNDQVTIINIPEAAHHLDLRHSNELDPESVIEARKLETITMRKWIKQFPTQK